MKAVVIKTKNGRAAVCDQNGGMRYIKDKGYVTGQILEIRNNSSAGMITIRTGIAVAAAVSIVVFGGGITANAVTVSTVSIGAVEYRVNAFDRVVGFDANDLDRDTADEIADYIRGERIDHAIEISMDRLGDRIDYDEPDIVVMSRIPGREQRLETMVREGMPERPMPVNEGKPTENTEPAEPPESAEPGQEFQNETIAPGNSEPDNGFEPAAPDEPRPDFGVEQVNPDEPMPEFAGDHAEPPAPAEPPEAAEPGQEFHDEPMDTGRPEPDRGFEPPEALDPQPNNGNGNPEGGPPEPR